MDTNVQKYQAFVTTVACGSFTQAARQLHYSQSGISRMIHDLEEEWQVTLLERGRAGVRLTSEGTALLPWAQKVCQAYEALQNQVEALHEMQGGLIRIGLFSSVATHWMPNIIRAFQKDYPNIDYELLLGDYTELEEWVKSGRVDCAFLRLPTCPEFDTIPLERDELMAILPENHPLAQEERVPLEALCQEPFLLLEKAGRSGVSELFQRAGLTPQVRFTTWDDYAILSMVESGMGVAILPQLILRRIPYRVAIRPLEEPAYREIALALRDRAGASQAVKRFLEYLSAR